MKLLLQCSVLAVVASAMQVIADDWPQWRGPERNGISRETGLMKDWPSGGPKLIWKQTEIGSGFSTPAIVGNRLYLLANEGMEDEYVQAHSVADGKRVWQTRLGKVGPNPEEASYRAARSTPTVDGESLYAIGSDGNLVCLDVSSGNLRWKKDLRADFDGKPGVWAYAESPLIDGDALICTPGGNAATMVALNKRNGEVIWKCATPEGDTAAFASPIIVELGGIRQYVQLLQKGLVGVEAKSGKLLWRYAKPVSKFDANIPSPVASGNLVFVASAGTGAGTIKLTPKNGEIEVEELYFNPKYPTAIGGAVILGDFLYGTSGQAMLCVEFASGDIKWQERALGPGALCYADGRLYLHAESGDVALIDPSPEGYREKGRFTPPDQPQRTKEMGKSWAYPVVANGRLYIRDHGVLWCYEVRGK